MPEESFKYDVAISFLSEDTSIAKGLNDKLIESGLEIFFFPGAQEILAGTDGLESMRAPFRHESRLNVVVFRPKWGNTPWTAVEEQAIKEACLDNSFRNIFVYVVEDTRIKPKWLPDTHVYFSATNYTMDQAVGAIKARVQDRGGEFKVLTPTRKAELMRAEQEFQFEKDQMLRSAGVSAIFSEVKMLFEGICAQADEVDDTARLGLRKNVTFHERTPQQICALTSDSVALAVSYYQPSGNSLHEALLAVRQFDQSLLASFVVRQPRPLREVQYIPSVSRGLQYGWALKKRPNDFISTAELANQCVMQLLDLIERDRDGKIRRPENRQRSGSSDKFRWQ